MSCKFFFCNTGPFQLFASSPFRYSLLRVLRVLRGYSNLQHTRHPVFQQMVTALLHQQSGNPDLALAYWENVLHILPEDMRIHNEVLAESARIAAEHDIPRLLEKVKKLMHIYRQSFTSEHEAQTFQSVYRAMTQQCSEHFTLACAYWQRALAQLTSKSLVTTLAVQDLCWSAHQYMHAGNIKACIELYEQTLKTFPEFIEGYINESLIKYKIGDTEEALQVLYRLPLHYQREFIISRYIELYQRMNELVEQFGHAPYAAIEKIVSDLRIENTYYPSIVEVYFTELMDEVIGRERRFYEKRRKAMEERAIAKTSKRLAEEGLALGQRVTLAKHAKSEEIQNFLYDNEIRIAEVLLDNPNISREDVLVMAQTTHVSEILEAIATHRTWRTFHNIVMAVLGNPQTLSAISITLLPRLSINDLATIFYKRTLPSEVRIRAKQHIQDVFNNLSLYDKVATIEATSGDVLKLLDEVTLEMAPFLEQLIEKFVDHPEIIVNICRWKLTPSPVLTSIAKKSHVKNNMQVAFALLSNPRTPMGIVIVLLQSLEERNLRDLLTNQHLPSSVKQSIVSLFPNVSS